MWSSHSPSSRPNVEPLLSTFPASTSAAKLRSARRGLRGAVQLHPPQRHAILSTYYRAADACVVPSRSESFGLVALEAAACGVPVVASAVGGLTTLVDHGQTGYLVEGRDPSDYAEVLTAILTDPRQHPPRE